MVVIKYALTTEKAVGAIENENKLTFIIEEDATKQEVAKEVEKEYGEKTRKITVCHTPDNRKKAVVAFRREGAAADLAARLKVI